jgi:hypothetical protein
MVTRAAKLRAKRESRGRPKSDGPREPSGRVSRSGQDNFDPPSKAAYEARVRMLGLTEDQAKDQKAGSFIGYLNLIGPRDGISQAQYEGALEYLRFRERHLRAIKSPAALYDPEARGSGGEEITDAYVAWCQDTEEEWGALKKEIQAEQNYCRGNLWAALQYAIIEDRQMHHMIGDIRILCNVLARHFKTMHEQRDAA